MSYTLRELIIASGYAGTSGQSFRNNVAGAASGAKMSDYKCNAWAFTGGPANGTTYSDHDSFTVTTSFTQGSRAGNIKRVGSMIAFSDTFGPDYTGTLPDHLSGFSIETSSSSVVAGDTGSSFTVKLRAPMANPSGYTGSAWFSGYTAPATPTYNGTDPDPVRFTASVNAGSSGTPSNKCFSVSYAPDIGPFNPTLYQTFPITMYTRPTDTNTSLYDWEWYNDSGYTSLYHSGVGFTVFSAPGNSFTYYLRARPTGQTIWTNVGAVTFTDNR